MERKEAGARESSRREQVDMALVVVLKAAHKTYGEVCALQETLVGAAGILPRPERPTRSGWLGEIQDKLGELVDYQEDTLTVLQDIAAQIRTQTPTPSQAL